MASAIVGSLLTSWLPVMSINPAPKAARPLAAVGGERSSAHLCGSGCDRPRRSARRSRRHAAGEPARRNRCAGWDASGAPRRCRAWSSRAPTLGAPVAEEAAGVGDDLLPTGGADTRRASNHTEPRDALDPIGEQWIGAVGFIFWPCRNARIAKNAFSAFLTFRRGGRDIETAAPGLPEAGEPLTRHCSAPTTSD